MQISFVRSVSLDDWSQRNVALLTKGGNKRFEEHLAKFGVSRNDDPRRKYYSKAAEYYRQLLKYEAYDEEQPEEISLEEGLIDMYQQEKEEELEIKHETIREDEEPKDEDLMDKLSGGMQSLFRKTKSIAGEATEKIKEMGIKDKIVGGSKKAFTKSKEIYNSEKVQGAITTAGKGVNSFVSGFKNFMNKKVLRKEENQT